VDVLDPLVARRLRAAVEGAYPGQYHCRERQGILARGRGSYRQASGSRRNLGGFEALAARRMAERFKLFAIGRRLRAASVRSYRCGQRNRTEALQLLKRIPDLGIIGPLASSCNIALTVGRRREAHSCLPS